MFLELITLTFVTFVGMHTLSVPSLQSKPYLITPLPKTSPSPTPSPTLTPTNTPTPIPTVTPTPQPTATPIPTSTPIPAPNDIDSLFSKYADEYHVDVNLLKKIAKCESGFNPEAENGPYTGMFQFAQPTWITTRTRMGQNTDPNLRKNAEEAIKTASYMIGNGGQNAWANCL